MHRHADKSPSFDAVPAHAAVGAALGLLCFVGLVCGPTRDLVLAAPEPTRLVLAAVMASLFAVASALTGFVFTASAPH